MSIGRDAKSVAPTRSFLRLAKEHPAWPGSTSDPRCSRARLADADLHVRPDHRGGSRIRADVDGVLAEGEVRLDLLVGREVLAGNNRRVGRLEEFRAEVRDGTCVVTEMVIGVAGLLERLGLGAKMILGKKGGGYVARWDQIDLRDPVHPRLTCSVADLQPIA